MLKHLATLTLLSCSLFAAELSPEVNIEQLSETMGHLLVRHLQAPGLTFNVEKIIQGMRDEVKQLPSPMSEEEYEQKIALIQEKVFLQLAEKNLSDSVAFLEKNAKQEGVITINPKLQYRVEKQGDGAVVDADSVPLIHYKGCLIDGTVFGSSLENDEPISLPIRQTIPGFSSGLVGMKEGEKRTLYIHPEMAYGISGHLPPNSLLIFEVEIVKASSEQPVTELETSMDEVPA